jgi:hypothetical protein
MVMVEPIITSVGPPPERHADRVVAAMMRHLVAQRMVTWRAIAKVLATSYDRSPRAQQKLAERLRRAGARHLDLEPGKKGRYRLAFSDVVGWDPILDDMITSTGEIPPRPWLAIHLVSAIGTGKAHDPVQHRAMPVLFITHHVLSRSAQRAGARTVADLMAVVTSIEDAAVGSMGELGVDRWLDPPPEGRRLQILGSGTEGSITVVLKRHETRHALVAATVF